MTSKMNRELCSLLHTPKFSVEKRLLWPLLLNFTHSLQPTYHLASHHCPAHLKLLFHIHVLSPVMSFCLSCWEDFFVFLSLITTHLCLLFYVWIQEFFSLTLSHLDEYPPEHRTDRSLALLSCAWVCCRWWKSEDRNFKGKPTWTEFEICSKWMKTSGL